jgi:hypothetical protein
MWALTKRKNYICPKQQTMAKTAIPIEIQEQVKQSVEKYNSANRANYQVTFKGKYCYLSRMDNRNTIEADAMLMAAKELGLPVNLFNQAPTVETKIGRLEWTGDMGKWGFAVFKYSRETYDADEWMFPGSDLLDGTIEGAMKAGHKIYP